MTMNNDDDTMEYEDGFTHISKIIDDAWPSIGGDVEVLNEKQARRRDGEHVSKGNDGKITYDLRPEIDKTKVLMRKGLGRDKANLVSLLIEMRGRMIDLRKLSRDGGVIGEIDALEHEISDTIEYVYQLQESENGGPRGGGGGRAA